MIGSVTTSQYDASTVKVKLIVVFHYISPVSLLALSFPDSITTSYRSSKRHTQISSTSASGMAKQSSKSSSTSAKGSSDRTPKDVTANQVFKSFGGWQDYMASYGLQGETYDQINERAVLR